VRQLGVDRVVDFTFGAGETAYHLILEMYAQVRGQRGFVTNGGKRLGAGPGARQAGWQGRLPWGAWVAPVLGAQRGLRAGLEPLRAPPATTPAQGNVILTNHKYEVLTLLRSHRWGEEAGGRKVKGGEVRGLCIWACC
jgi:hypothetical protein